VDLKGDFAGLCAIAQLAHAEGSAAIVEMAMAMIVVRRERGFRLRAGWAYGWELAANLQCVDKFSEQDMQRLRELLKAPGDAAAVVRAGS
jgi:methyl coenzyme M reductase alpha subunit